MLRLWSMPRTGGTIRFMRKKPDTRIDSVGRTLRVVGDYWTFLVLREAFFRVRRFDAMHKNLGISRNILADRLKRLVRYGILRKRRYQDGPPRYEYRLTEKGLDLYGVSVAMMVWGDKWLNRGAGPPLRLIHKRCGQPINPLLVCSNCGLEIVAREMDFEPSPGARGLRRAAEG